MIPRVGRRAALMLGIVFGLAFAVAQSDTPSEPIAPPAPSAPEPTLPKSGISALPLELLLDTTEPKLRAGRIAEARVTQRFALPPFGVTVSRERGQPSTGLLDALTSAVRSVRRPAAEAR